MMKCSLLGLAAFLVFAVQSISAQGASLTGSVLADSTEKPLQNAEVTIAEVKLATRSDEKGYFTIAGIPAGKHAVAVRLVGYEPFNADITFNANQKVEADFLLTLASTKLKKVNVKGVALPNPRLAEFEERRASPAGGTFFTADVFEKAQGSNISDILLGKIPGMRRVYLKTTNVRPLTGRATGMRTNCFVAIRLNHQVVYDTSYGDNYFDIDRIITADVIGAEYYTEATIPMEFRATNTQCGLLVIWTKG